MLGDSARRAWALVLGTALIGASPPPQAAAAIAPVLLRSGVAAPIGSAAAVSKARVSGSLLFAPNVAPLSPSPAVPILSPVVSAGTPAAAASDAAVPSKSTASSWLSLVGGLFRPRAEASAAENGASDEKARLDQAFDAAQPASASDDGAVPASGVGRVANALKIAARTEIETFKAERAIEHDAFGGPPRAKMTFGERVKEGLRVGVDLTGIGALMSFVEPAVRRLPWPLLLSPKTMSELGRVELMAHFGPAEIQTALIHSPLKFLGMAVPLSAAQEEIWYRFFVAGASFVALAAAKPAADALSHLLDRIPDAENFRVEAQKRLRDAASAISYVSFPLAAGFSAYQFSAAHVAHWGFDPVTLATQAIAGYALARAGYKTRGLTAPFVAHLVFNLAGLLPLAIGASLGSPKLGAAVYFIVSAVSASALVLRWLDLGAARITRALKSLLLAAAIAATPPAGRALWNAGPSALRTSMAYALSENVRSAEEAPAVVLTPDHPMTLPTAKPPFRRRETSVRMIARVKPSVLQIITPRATGSGVIVTPDGGVVTNAHVVGERAVGDVIQAQTSSGRLVPVKILALNHDRDQAYLQLPPFAKGKSWPISTFASSLPREGETVYAMGHPLGLPLSVARGIVSGRGSRGNMYVQYLQTDAPINPGNSGGPLYNARGEIVGINTMVWGTGESIGLGFSIVAPTVVHAIEQYAATGGIDTAALGVVADLSSPIQPDRGVAVEFVRPGSPAQKAGLKAGDVILAAAGTTIDEDGGQDSARALAAILARLRPGARVELTVLRDSHRISLWTTLSAKKTSGETSISTSLDEAP